MKLVYKICLIFGAFFALAGVAWARFNYESLTNNFLIDSILKSGGDYIIVGNALDNSLVTEGTTETSKFFAVTNNLIFSGDDAKFCTITNPGDDTCTGSRQIQKNSEGDFDFKTKSISIDNTKSLYVSPLAGRDGYNLYLEAPKITANKDLVLNNASFTLSDAVTLLSNSVYAPIIAANKISKYDNTYIDIGNSNQVSVLSSVKAKQMRAITVTGATAGQPVAIILLADLLTGEKMRLDGWDLNFYPNESSARAGTGALPFFIDIMPKVWVQMPATGNTIYMTYGGEASKVNPSDPAGVFGSGNVLGNTNIVASFNFDETTGFKILDTSIFGPGGALTPVAEADSMRLLGKINNAIKTVHGQYIRLDNSIPLSTEWTIETWILTPPNTGSLYNILARGNADSIIAAVTHGDGLYLGTWQAPPKPSGWNACDTDLVKKDIQGYNLRPNKLTPGWHHLFAVGKNGTTEFYVDGGGIGGTPTCTSAYQSQDSILYLGNASEGSRSWGSFDEFRAYNQVLSPAVITKLSATANCSFTTLALPGKVIVKPCTNPSANVPSATAETCLENCDNIALNAGLVTEAEKITYTKTESGVTTDKNFCIVKTWNAEANKTAATINQATPGPNFTGACTQADTTGATLRACCDNNYFVFDFDANAGKMVCCRYNTVAPAP